MWPSGIDHLALLVVDPEAAEGEGDAAGHRIGLERGVIDGAGPVATDGTVRPVRATAVLGVGIERLVRLHRAVEFRDRLEELRRLSTSSIWATSPSSVSAPTLVTWRVSAFAAQQVRNLGVIDLPGDLARLPQHGLAVFRVGVVAEVGAFVDEALALAVDHDPERIASGADMAASH